MIVRRVVQVSSKFIKNNYKFRTYLSPPKTLVELKLIKISQEIRSKPDWIEKVKDANIVSKWKSEVSVQDVTVDEFQYILDELNYYASLKDGPIEVGPVDGTWQSDELIEESLEKSFKKSVFELLENVDESERDYHPGSNNLVVDLVHPSLFCFVRGVSKISDESGLSSEMINQLSSSEEGGSSNSKYRWLPSDVSSNENGKVTFESYINNLPHKQNEQLYSLIGRILSRFLPMFSRVLGDIVHPRPKRLQLDNCNWYDDSHIFEYQRNEEGDEQEQYERWYKQRVVQMPKISKFEPPPSFDFAEFSLRGEKLQVIVKLANIELTPTSPEYKGGVWHIEATDSEAIVATGIYYYSMKNITESRLKFREATDNPPYEQDDWRGVLQVFGFRNDGPLNQEIGSLIAREGRCVVFPNTYQHKVAPFDLIDKTKNGHRKILVFFLVDPTKRVISTRNVAPQNPIWNDEPVDRFTMSLNEAKKYRESLMVERKFVRESLDGDLFENKFSLCEH